MLVLDTDILTIIQRASSVEYARLIARLPASDPLSVHVTIITVEEQLRGWLSYVAKAQTRDKRIEAYSRLRGFIRDLSARQILDFDGAAADQFEQLVKAKLRIGSMDLKIAAIALANNAKLLFRNLSDYRKVPGLQVEDWTLP